MNLLGYAARRTALHGRKPWHIVCALSLLPAVVAGCAETTAPAAAGKHAIPAFDAAASIEGQVVWAGKLPAVERFPHPIAGDLGEHNGPLRRNPFAPVIDRASRAVSDVVVYLRGVDVERARPWDHPPVRIEQRDWRLHVVQGKRDTGIGLMRCGDPIDMVSRDARLHALRARGATHFTLAFPDPDQPLSRTLNAPGVVELTSGVGYYWMRAYLWVCEHPYFALTDAGGRFVLPQVPPGRYDLVCWLPNWREEGYDRNPDTGLVTRLRFGAPGEEAQSVEIGAGERRKVRVEISETRFSSSACCFALTEHAPNVKPQASE
jgi:hypothetical protein